MGFRLVNERAGSVHGIAAAAMVSMSMWCGRERHCLRSAFKKFLDKFGKAGDSPEILELGVDF